MVTNTTISPHASYCWEAWHIHLVAHLFSYPYMYFFISHRTSHHLQIYVSFYTTMYLWTHPSNHYTSAHFSIKSPTRPLIQGEHWKPWEHSRLQGEAFESYPSCACARNLGSCLCPRTFTAHPTPENNCAYSRDVWGTPNAVIARLEMHRTW